MASLCNRVFIRGFCTGSRKHKVVVIGGGCGGLAVSHQMLRRYPGLDLAIVEPADFHYYQPGWTFVGSGVYPDKYQTQRAMKDVMPRKAKWVKQSVTRFFPEENSIELNTGEKLEYKFLVVSAGLQINLDKVKGLSDAVGKGGVTTNYLFNYCDKTWEFLKKFKGGEAVFTQPSTPIKCGGAPQKIMYLAEDHFTKNRIRPSTNVSFFTGTPKLFAAPAYAEALEKICKSRNININLAHDLVEVKPEEQVAVFKQLPTGTLIEKKYNFLHVTPPMGPPSFIQNSPLANEAGWVDVNKATLRHNKYRNVFALGDCSSLPTSKTAAAVCSQSQVLGNNLFAALHQQEGDFEYDGYTGCPIPTEKGKLMMAEFDYTLQRKETFPFDQRIPRESMYFFKKNIFPLMYWNLLIKGRWQGPSTLPFKAPAIALGYYP